MKKFLKAALWVFGAIWAALAVAATVPASQAISNLQSWANLLGFVTLAPLFAAKGVDYLVQVGTLLIAAITAVQFLSYQKWKKEIQQMIVENENRAVLNEQILLNSIDITNSRLPSL